MKKYRKGQYGYRTYRKKTELLKVGFGLAMILIQLAARMFVDSTAWKNVLTVMAILSVLPTANVAAPLLAGWRYKTPPEEFYKKISAFENDFIILYDLIITSKENIMPMDAILVHSSGVFAYCTAPKIDGKKAERFLKEMFLSNHLEANIKVIMDEKTFLHRISSLKPEEIREEDPGAELTVRLLKNLSM